MLDNMLGIFSDDHHWKIAPNLRSSCVFGIIASFTASATFDLLPYFLPALMTGATRPLDFGPCSLAFPFLQGWPCILLWHTMPGTGWLSPNSEMVGYRSWYVLIKYRYVVSTPLKNMSSSVETMTFPTEWNIIIQPCSKPPTRISTSPSPSRTGPSNL